jgi:hypothetical protein
LVLVFVALFLLPDVVPVGVVPMLSVPLIEPDVVLMVPLVLVPLVVPMVPPVLVPIVPLVPEVVPILVVVPAVVPLVVRVPAVVPLVLMPEVVVWANAARLKPKANNVATNILVVFMGSRLKVRKGWRLFEIMPLGHDFFTTCRLA